MNSEIQVLESSFVKPMEPTPMKGLWLSSLDLEQATRSHIPTFYLYSSNDVSAAPDFFDVARLKEAMAKALVTFYPLAGRLIMDNDGSRMEISCNDEGALFVVARSDLTIVDIKDMKPSPKLRKLVVPCIEPTSSVVLAVQTWSALSKHGDGAAVELPCHDRTLLRARSPPTVHQDAFLTLYTKAPFSDPSGPVAVQVFTISSGQVASLKRLCGGTSTFCAVSALVWQCVCIARRLRPDSEARLSFTANVRGRVKPPLPSRYFGNALVRLGVTAAARDIASEALASVAGRIKGAISRMDDELVRSAVDYYETAWMDSRRGPGPRLVTARGIFPQTHLHVISWLGMPMYDADFGWGKPRVMSRAESVRSGILSLSLTNNGTADDGGVSVFMCMEAANMMELERLLYARIDLYMAIGPCRPDTASCHDGPSCLTGRAYVVLVSGLRPKAQP